MSERVTEYQLIPDGLEELVGEEQLYVNYRDFCLTVAYTGKGNWMVCQGLQRSEANQLSRGGNWAFYPQRFQRWQYRFDSAEHALNAARKALPELRFRNMDWKEVHEWRTRER